MGGVRYSAPGSVREGGALKRLRWIGLAALALASFFAGGWLLRRGLVARAGMGSADAAPGISGNRLFDEVARHVRTHAVDSLDDAAIYRLAASGMLAELDDPYAQLVPGRAAWGRVESSAPLGLVLDLADRYIVVVSVRPGSPAARAGVRSGDIVLEVGERRADGLRPESLARLLEADSGGEVHLRLARAGSSPIRVTIPRGPTPELPDVELERLSGDVAYLRLYTIDRPTVQRLSRLLDSAARPRQRALILDLRGVAEGDLPSSVSLAERFLPPRALIVTSRGRIATESRAIVAGPDGRGSDFPVVLLVDGGTAGPAEVLAGALQDHDRALLIGGATFGRGGEQSTFDLGGGASLRLTTSLWVTPSGRVIQRSRAPDPAPGDTARDRPAFKTTGGRPVLGGGGIVPDWAPPAPRGEGGADDPALGLAQRLLARARSTRTLLALRAEESGADQP